MKIDRLIGILSILLQQEKVTAPDLAERFEVSRRTINRDIDTLCQAGIPLVTTQGRDGGITVMDGFRIDRTLLSASEMQAVLAGLKSLDSVAQTRRYQQLMDKLSAASEDQLPIRINLSSWYRDTLAPKIQLLQTAIDQKNLISFQYYGPKGETRRQAEPYTLVFHWSSWYLWGFCRTKEAPRLFKLNRMQELTAGEAFTPREMPPCDLSPEKVYPMDLSVSVLVDADMKWRLVDEFGSNSFEEWEDGRLLFQFQFSDRENLICWVLSFAGRAELLEPAELRRDIAELGKTICKKHGET